MLSIHYAPHIPAAMIELAEHHARANGISLTTLERIGQSLDFIEQFIIASEDGCAELYASQFENIHPTTETRRRTAQIETARVQAAQLFGYK